MVASQALISAWYSLTQQLMNLGYVPRLSVRHTSSHEEGQIYVPKVNTALMFGCLALVVWFGSSSALAAAYGLSVTGTMAVTTILFYFVARTLWRWGRPQALTVCGVFLIAELALLGANLPKVFHGGWVPLAVGALLYLLMSTWRRGRLLLGAYFQRSALDIDLFLADIASRNPPRVHGTAIFFSKEPTGVPHVLLHHLKHCEVLHDRVVLLSILTDRVPEVPRGREVETIDLGQGFYRMTLRHGFRQSPNVTRALAAMTLGDLPVNLAKTSFYFGRETILATGRGAMAVWRKELFSVMARNAKPATAYFGIPPNRVVELGTQIAL